MAVHRVGYVLAAEGQRDRADAAGAHGCQCVGCVAGDGAQQAAGDLGRGCQYDGVRFDGFARRQDDAVTVRVALDGLDGGLQAQVAGELRNERVDQRLRAAGKREEGGQGGCGRGGFGGARATQQAAVAGFEGGELREGRAQALGFDVRIVDAAEQRLGQPVERFAAQPTPDERRDRLVAGLAARRDERFEQDAQLAGEREQRRAQERAEFGRHEQRHAFGQRQQAAVPGDVGPTGGRVDAEDVTGQTQLARQCVGPRLARQKGVGTRFDDERRVAKAVDTLGGDFAAPAVARFEQHVVNMDSGYRGLHLHIPGAAQTGDAAADDDDAASCAGCIHVRSRPVGRRCRWACAARCRDPG